MRGSSLPIVLAGFLLALNQHLSNAKPCQTVFTSVETCLATFCGPPGSTGTGSCSLDAALEYETLCYERQGFNTGVSIQLVDDVCKVVSLNNGDLGNVLANSQRGEYITTFNPFVAGRAGLTTDICNTNWCTSLTKAGLVPFCGNCDQVIKALKESGVDSG